MLVLLVGPKGSGKSHIGRVLERALGVRFCHVEPRWMAYHAECRAAGREPVIAEGIARVHPTIAEELRESEHLCVETTGASPEILNDLLSLASPSETLLVRVAAPLELCLERIRERDRTHQIPMDPDGIRTVYERSVAADLSSALTLENTALSEEEIVDAFRAHLSAGARGRPGG